MTSQPELESKTTGIVLGISVCKNRDNFKMLKDGILKFGIQFKHVIRVSKTLILIATTTLGIYVMQCQKIKQSG